MDSIDALDGIEVANGVARTSLLAGPVVRTRGLSVGEIFVRIDPDGSLVNERETASISARPTACTELICETEQQSTASVGS
jgi:hypothetical protein